MISDVIQIVSDDDDDEPIIRLIQHVCFFFSLLAFVISVRLIVQHLRHFSQPVIQRKIIAILWMVPLYSCTAWLSLEFVHASLYLDMVRDCYESFVIYMFFALCYCYIGQVSRERIDTSRIYAVLTTKGSVDHLIDLPTWLRRERRVDLAADPHSFLLTCKLNILQFVVVKPLSTILAIVLAEYFGCYETGNFSLTNGYIYITVIVNSSISLSMYWLVMFYQATKESLEPFSPVPKFLCIKGVLFFSYWQSVIITILVAFGVITELPVIHYTVEHVASTIQNALICVEMAGFAISHAFAFPAQPFFFLPTRLNSSAFPIPGQRLEVTTSARAMLRNAVDFRDVMTDLQEVAPEIPLIRYLRRNSTNLSESTPPPPPLSVVRVSIPSTEGIEQIRTASRNTPPR